MNSEAAVNVGSQRPTLLHLPADGLPGAGREAVDLAAEIGIVLDDWQQFCVESLLLERPNHQWAATEGACEVARQNGKNVIQIVIEIAGLLLFNEQLITHSAHLFDTALEHFLQMQALFEDQPLLRDLVDDIYTSNGKEAIVLRGGARLKFRARSKGGGRGFTGDRTVFDEAFSLSSAALGAMIPALSARSMEIPGPQILYFSSPAHADSAALHSIRKRAQAGAPRLVYLGWLNEPGTDRRDRPAWYRVNPGLGIRISEEFVETELAALEDHGDEFDRERLGIPSAADNTAGVFPPGTWSACTDIRSTIGDAKPAVALDVSPNMEYASFGAAGLRTDGLVHLELIERHPGTGWVIGRAKHYSDRYDGIWIDPRGPAGGLIPKLAEAGVVVREVADGAVPKACAALQERVIDGTIRHTAQPPLDAAVAGAQIRPSGDSWRWSRTSSKVDITPLVAITVALWATAKNETEPMFAWA